MVLEKTYSTPQALLAACRWGVVSSLIDQSGLGTGGDGSIIALTGYPYASAMSYALSEDGDIIVLISSIAQHTKFITSDPRVSLFVTAAGPEESVLPCSRATFAMSMIRDDSPDLVALYTKRFPEAVGYAQFHDFATYRGMVQGVHFIEGFGKVRTYSRQEYLVASGHFSGYENY